MVTAAVRGNGHRRDYIVYVVFGGVRPAQNKRSLAVYQFGPETHARKNKYETKKYANMNWTTTIDCAGVQNNI